MPRTFDVSREGSFDAYSSLMDTGDIPLVTTGLPGCPYRITSYTGPSVADANPVSEVYRGAVVGSAVV